MGSFATTLANAKAADKDYKLSDGAGLYLLVRPNGSKLWRFNYVHHGKRRMLAFGVWPDVGLADARSRRDEARRLVAAGLDPSHEEKVAQPCYHSLCTSFVRPGELWQAEWSKFDDPGRMGADMAWIRAVSACWDFRRKGDLMGLTAGRSAFPSYPAIDAAALQRIASDA